MSNSGRGLTQLLRRSLSIAALVLIVTAASQLTPTRGVSRPLSAHIPVSAAMAAPERASAKSPYDQAILADKPILYLSLTTDAGGFVDQTGKGHNGRSVGGYKKTSFSDGSSAVAFNGSNQYVEVRDHPSLSVPATGVLTIEAWMRPDVLQFSKVEGSGYVYWMGKGEPNRYEYASRMYSRNNDEDRPNRISGYAFNLDGGLGVGSFFQDPVKVGEWIHYAFVINVKNANRTYPKGYTKIFKNGVARDQDGLDSLSPPITPSHGSAPFRIATRDGHSFFRGSISKVAIYNYELTAPQLRAHYAKIQQGVAAGAGQPV